MGSTARQFYATPGRFTSIDADPMLGDHLAGPADRIVEQVVDIVQGLLIYDVVAEPFYGVDLQPIQAEAIHERDTARLLTTVRSVDGRPLTEARPPEKRVGARCHAYSRVTVALLRAAGVAARARCGFAGYFRPGWLEDHWVAEYWDPATERWRMVDAQLDETWRSTIGFAGDQLDITPEEFVTAGRAWQGWRSGALDAMRCGLSAIEEHGPHWIANNLRLDLASLNKVEMLPWDGWGAGWEPGEEPPDETIELFDLVAELTEDPDASFDDLRSRYDGDGSLRVGQTVFNVARGQTETV